MRNSSVSQITGAPLTAPILLCGSAQQRVRLRLSIDTGTGFVTPSQSALTGVGFVLTSTAPLEISREGEGDIVTQAWYGSSTSNASKFGVLETFEGVT